MSAAISPNTDRAAWLEARREGIGASEAAAVLGVSPFSTPLKVYLLKTGQLADEEGNEAMRRGQRYEGPILEEYQDLTGCRLETQVFVRHPIYPYLFATLDGVRPDGRLVEAKFVGWRSAREWGEDGTDEIPFHYLCQVMHQLAVTGAQRADVVALIAGGPDLRIYPIKRHQKLINSIEDGERAFWGRVERREPPEPSEADGGLIRHLYRPSEESVELLEHTAADALRWDKAGEEIQALEAERKRLAARVKTAIGEGGASVGLLPDGRRVKWHRRIEDRPEKLVPAAKIPKDYIQILKGRPE